MTSWICPECGGECSPAQMNCPVCTGTDEIGTNNGAAAGGAPATSNGHHSLETRAEVLTDEPIQAHHEPSEPATEAPNEVSEPSALEAQHEQSETLHEVVAPPAEPVIEPRHDHGEAETPDAVAELLAEPVIEAHDEVSESPETLHEAVEPPVEPAIEAHDEVRELLETLQEAVEPRAESVIEAHGEVSEPPALEAQLEQTETLQEAVEPPSEPVVEAHDEVSGPPALEVQPEHTETFHEVVEPPAELVIEAHDEVSELPALETQHEQTETLYEAVEPPAELAVEAHEVSEPSALETQHDQTETLHEVVEPPAEPAVEAHDELSELPETLQEAVEPPAESVIEAHDDVSGPPALETQHEQTETLHVVAEPPAEPAIGTSHDHDEAETPEAVAEPPAEPVIEVRDEDSHPPALENQHVEIEILPDVVEPPAVPGIATHNGVTDSSAQDFQFDKTEMVHEAVELPAEPAIDAHHEVSNPLQQNLAPPSEVPCEVQSNDALVLRIPDHLGVEQSSEVAAQPTHCATCQSPSDSASEPQHAAFSEPSPALAGAAAKPDELEEHPDNREVSALQQQEFHLIRDRSSHSVAKLTEFAAVAEPAKATLSEAPSTAPLFPGVQRVDRPFSPQNPSSWTSGLAGGWQQLPIYPLVFSSAEAVAIPHLPDRLAVGQQHQPPAANARTPLTPPPPVAPAGSAKKRILPPWARTAAAVVLVGLISTYIAQKLSSGPESSATTPKQVHAIEQPEVPSRAIVPTPLAPTTAAPIADPNPEPEYPYARFVEVTGLRVVPNGDHSEVHYLVVNHSSSELTDIGLKVSVRSAAAPEGSLPLFTLSARVPTLGSHQSKEIRTTLQLTASQVPDWENLRTEVKVVSEQ